ncbi:MAG: Uma2 family endonuclease [Coleofasciculaceae cyanobacterium SM2_1_6]|nr:Uma2 family endonuclease [Coleofasciculaceae cyanobacterium SM2_1_6]
MPDGKHSTLQGELTSRINEIGKPKKLLYAFLELQCDFDGSLVASRKTRKTITVEEFLELPETDPKSEYFNGRIYQKFSREEHSTLQGTIIGRSIVPDISVFMWENIPRDEEGKITNKINIFPDWIIEILSPEQRISRVMEKMTFCFEYGTKLGWLIDPEQEVVLIFYEDKMLEIKRGDEQLPALEVLQDWQLSAAELFRWLYVDL